MPRVLIAPATLDGVPASFVDVLVKGGFELVYHGVGAQLDEEQAIRWLAGIDASLAGSEPYTDRVLAAHPQLRVIARVGVGYDAVDLAAATRRGVAVTFAPGTNQGSVSEHAFGLMLALSRRLIPQHLGTAAGQWPRGTTVPLRGQVLGLAGLGRIGRAMATRAFAFEMEVIAHDPFADKAWASANGVELVGFDELMSRSDYVSLHMPAGESTRRIINARSLALMKPTAYLVNTARGAVVDEAALAEALASKRIAGAGLDVFDEEPPHPDNPLLKLDNVVLTPHAAGTDYKSRDDMAHSAAEAIVSLFRGEWPAEKVVNPAVREAWKR
ncbi:MAG: phosphoglycerate dehydrogenase [Gemmataceae bacterium]|nr:phosphoglycerate dehydrogenase [Gemmataceae bacterium]